VCSAVCRDWPVFFNPVSGNGQSQITTGAIYGVVSDSSGAVVPNAKVDLKNIATGIERTVSTDEAGRYTAPLLQVGEYEITAEAQGFGKAAQRGYTLTLGQSLRADMVLNVSAVSAEVSITAEAPLVETSLTETSTLINARAVESLPLNGRRFLDLAFLTPGVVQEPERNQLAFSGSREINININIDGADFKQPVFRRPTRRRKSYGRICR
jgi:Carboxypeptidase regulatory-like domain